jgi:hypothetical protein
MTIQQHANELIHAASAYTFTYKLKNEGVVLGRRLEQCEVDKLLKERVNNMGNDRYSVFICMNHDGIYRLDTITQELFVMTYGGEWCKSIYMLHELEGELILYTGKR